MAVWNLNVLRLWPRRACHLSGEVGVGGWLLCFHSSSDKPRKRISTNAALAVIIPRVYPLPFAALGVDMSVQYEWFCCDGTPISFLFQVDGFRFNKREACRIQASEKGFCYSRCCGLLYAWMGSGKKKWWWDAYPSAVVRSYCGRCLLIVKPPRWSKLPCFRLAGGSFLCTSRPRMRWRLTLDRLLVNKETLDAELWPCLVAGVNFLKWIFLHLKY